MVELITADKPGFVCLQEVPAWALNQIGEWAGMQSIPARSRKSKVGFVPVPAGLGRRIPALGTSGRAARDGSGNVILAPADAKLRQVKQITLNTNPFCEEQARKLGLTPKLARWWERERRVCHLAKIELPNRRRLQIATLETTRYPADLRLADAELRRAASFVDRASDLEEIVVVAGHFNTTFAQSETLQWLMARETDRYTATEPLSDVLVREGRAADARAWSDDERSYDGKLLSEHAPVELQLLARVVRQVAPQEAPLGPIPRPEPAPTPARPKADDDERWETEERWEAEDAGRWETDEGGWETER
jgi:hypothetical protein